MEGNTNMRRSILALTLATLALLASGTAALAAPAPTQTISFTGSANFNSILGGSTNGIATVSGDVRDGTLGTLHAEVNLPLRDMSLTIDPTDVIVLQTQQIPVQWSRFVCDQFGCTYSTGVSTFEYQRMQ